MGLVHGVLLSDGVNRSVFFLPLSVLIRCFLGVIITFDVLILWIPYFR